MFANKLTIFLAIVACLLPLSIASAHEMKKDAAAFFYLKKNAVNIPQMIEAVENEQKGKVVSFKVEGKENEDSINCEIKIVKDGKIIETKIDPKSGKILTTESGGIFSSFSDEQKEIPSPAKLSLKDSISIVEKQYGGITIVGALQKESYPKMYRIKLATNGGAFWIMVDADNGELFRLINQNGSGENDEDDEE